MIDDIPKSIKEKVDEEMREAFDGSSDSESDEEVEEAPKKPTKVKRQSKKPKSYADTIDVEELAKIVLEKLPANADDYKNDTNYEPIESTAPKQKKKRKNTYVRGGAKTKGYATCKKLLSALDHIPLEEQEGFFRDFVFKNKIDNTKLLSIVTSCTTVLNDLSVLNDDAVIDIMTEMEQLQHVDGFDKWCDDLNTLNTAQIDIKIQEMHKRIAEIQREIRIATYFKHLKTDYKSKVANLSGLIIKVMAGQYR